MFSNSLGQYLGAKWLNPMVRLYLGFLETVQLSSKVAVPSYIPISNAGEFLSSESWPAIGILSF